MLKWAGVVLAIGVLLIFFEYSVARKKKEGVTWTDKQKMIGIFWVSCGLAALTSGLIWMAG